MEQFEQEYKAMKEQWLTDAEIAKKMLMSIGSLNLLKRQYGIKAGTRCKGNVCDVTAEHIKQAKQLGLSRRYVIKRVRDFKWSIERAISTPTKKRGK